MDWFRGPTVTSILNRLTNYSHTAIGSAYAASALIYHVKTGRDLGSGFVTFSGYFYAFLLGHAGVYQKWPDRDAGQASPGGTDDVGMARDSVGSQTR
jgi:hypothetical protein